MNEELIPFIAFFLIFFGWVFYINRGDGKQQKLLICKVRILKNIETYYLILIKMTAGTCPNIPAGSKINAPLMLQLLH